MIERNRGNQNRRLGQSGFTLIEMLTVIAITAVLLTIIVLPIFQSFDMTRAAEAFADAQSQGRYLTEKISREIGGAVSVRATNNLIPTTLNIDPTSAANVSLPNSSVVVQVPSTTGPLTGPGGQMVEVALPYTKLDLVPPAQGQDPADIGLSGNAGFTDPVSGKVDPTLVAPKGQVATPVIPSQVMIRYWVGLRDPSLGYNDPYTGLLMARAGGRDNLYVLYRGVTAPYVWVNLPDPNNPPQKKLQKVVNTSLFGFDPNNPANTPYPTVATLDDPRFMVLDTDNTGAIRQDDHNVRVYHWQGKAAPWEIPITSSGNIQTIGDVEHNQTFFAHSIIQTEISRYDMVSPQYNKANRQVTYDTVTIPGGGGAKASVPRLTPLVQFRPTIISNDPTAGQEALRQGEETDSAALIAPDVYKTEYGLWNNAVVRTFTAGYLQSDNTRDQYVMGYTGLNPNVPGFSEYYYDPAGGGEFTTGFEFFDTYTYDNAISLGDLYPFTAAALAANFRSGWLNQSQVHNLFTPYHVLSGPGKIIASFDISEVGVTSLPNDQYEDANRPNLPTMWLPNTYAPQSPINDPGTGAPWSPVGTTLWTPTNSGVANPYDINREFNLAWNQYPTLQSGSALQRFLDTRVVPNEDGTYSPLYPGSAGARTVTGFLIPQNGSTLSRCRIVPGSETVYGPDQRPGPNYGRPVRYTRITSTRGPGPDQYRINYTDIPEPTDSTGTVTAAAYQAAFGLTGAQVAGFNPAVYDPTNFVSAVLQPYFKAGYLQLNSDPNLPLPNGYQQNGSTIPVPFKVSFRFQFTGSLPANKVPAGAGTTDVFAVDYDTRQLMQVLLTIRNYPQSNQPNPQSITLKSTASIRNFAR